MNLKTKFRKSVVNQLCLEKKLYLNSDSGQALVEFTLVFILLLVISWIPAEFGLAFYTGQLAQNAAREGARIAAADPNLASATVSCTMPCSSEPAGSILATTRNRIAGTAMLSAATITLVYPSPAGSGCNQTVRVTVTGRHYFFFYQLLRLLGANQPTNFINITRFTDMRWEHQAGC